MLLHSGLQKTFWAEAASTAYHLRNRTPSVPNGFIILLKIGRVHHQVLINSDCLDVQLMQMLNKENHMLRAIKCIFLGYPDGLKGYKLRCIEAGNMRNIISRDVNFKEDEFPLKKLRKDLIQEKHNHGSEETSLEVEFATLSSQNEEIIDDSTLMETSETSRTPLIRAIN